MPRSLDPESKLILVLDCDVDKPEETQPRIFAKSPTLGTQRRLVKLLSQLGTGDISEKVDAIVDAVMLCLTGWENIPLEFSREAVEDVLNLDEVVEVLSFLASQSTATAEDKKKSESLPS